ncbi:kinase-like domain-containing protein, partial [Tuber borchii]
ELAAAEMEDYDALVHKLPALKLNYEIGSGFFGIVFLEKVQIREMESPALWAVKRIAKDVPYFPIRRYQEEVKNLQALSKVSFYEWFIQFYDTCEDLHCTYIAMEYIPIGDMLKTFVNGYRWNESDTKVVIKQLLQGLAVMHQEGITHRDLKPENIFLSLSMNETQSLHVKVGDFGTSKHIPLLNASTCLKTTTGTSSYMASEMLDRSKHKTNRVDIWSLGRILYRMSAGSPLFKDLFELYRYAATASAPPLALENRGLSPTCVKFLRDVLQPTSEDRPSAEACLENSWIVNDVPRSQYSIGKDLSTRLFKIKLGAPDIDSLSDVVTDLEPITLS